MGRIMGNTRYWGLFWIAAGLSLHALVVGKLLGSSFFMMLFFWGFVGIAGLRGALDTAQSMAIVMITFLTAVAAFTVLRETHTSADLAYTTFALYPALVSWISVFFYIRFLRVRDEGELPYRRPLLRQRRAG
ncbi:hypothetical protein [Aestuariivirga sp.]|uniref:hypothetical protein n=1 Tax=Aestuariivirga sp. TaxID=2650926 RepID=UPI003BA9AAF5